MRALLKAGDILTSLARQASNGRSALGWPRGVTPRRPTPGPSLTLLWIYPFFIVKSIKRGWAFARIAYAGRDYSRGVLPRLCALSKWVPGHQCKIRPTLYVVASIWKKEELHTGQVFRLQRRDKKGDSPPARGKIPVCLFNGPDKRKGLH